MDIITKLRFIVGGVDDSIVNIPLDTTVVSIIGYKSRQNAIEAFEKLEKNSSDWKEFKIERGRGRPCRGIIMNAKLLKRWAFSCATENGKIFRDFCFKVVDRELKEDATNEGPKRKRPELYEPYVPTTPKRRRDVPNVTAIDECGPVQQEQNDMKISTIHSDPTRFFYEASVSNELAQCIGGRREHPTPFGIFDVITDTTIYEVKRFKVAWYGIGQLLRYGFSEEAKTRQLVLFVFDHEKASQEKKASLVKAALTCNILVVFK